MSQRRPYGLRTALLGALTGVVLCGAASPALAAPPPPPNPSDSELGSAQSAQDAAPAEVGRLAGLVASAEAELERLGVLAEAAGTAYLAAEESYQQAQAVAEQKAAELQASAEAVATAEARIALFSRDSYMNGGALTSSAALLDSAGPGELIQRAAMLDYVAANHLDVLNQLEVAKVAQANADSAARKARDEQAAAQEAAQAAKEAADAQLAAQQATYEQVSAQKATYDAQLQAAQIHLLQLQGARDAYQAWAAQKAAEEAAAAAAAERAARDAAAAAAAKQSGGRGRSGGGGGGGGGDDSGPVAGSGDYVKPASGRVSSCFGARWGVTHYGVDIAAPIGTAIYAATSGVVERAGPATGFGPALYVPGNAGAVTGYGHVNRCCVAPGERVAAGEKIAEVGNRGQSTGPHLHFEVRA